MFSRQVTADNYHGGTNVDGSKGRPSNHKYTRGIILRKPPKQMWKRQRIIKLLPATKHHNFLLNSPSLDYHAAQRSLVHNTTTRSEAEAGAVKAEAI